MIYHSTERSSSYFPPILGNGDMTFPVDLEGSVCQTQADYSHMVTFDSVIYRAGRRLGVTHDTVPGKIVSFGKLRFLSESAVKDWSQELLEDQGLIRSTVRYEDGTEILTECFIHPERNLYALRKTFQHLPTHNKFSWQYELCGYDTETENMIINTATIREKTGFALDFRIFGQDIYNGQAKAFADQPMAVALSDRQGTMTFEVNQGDSISLFFCLEDDLDGCNYRERILDHQSAVSRLGYEGLRQENVAFWQAYYARSYISTPNETLNRIYRVALYHLRCYTTKWSIPVGINNSHWDGRYFAFDEYYSYLGLLGTNQHDLARHVPQFRLDVCLPKAIARNTNQTEEQARFPWETNEYGEERAPTGFWMDHVFHMCIVAMGAFEYYEYTQDVNFLQDCYRMIRACAKFFTLHMLYRDGDRLILGKCTDLERLGSSVENPFMTACGVIKTLEVCSQAAEILGIDEDYMLDCREKANRLRESLPVENGRYVPHLNCKQKSIAVFAGQFPFQVLPKDDEKQLLAWEDFVENEEQYGNMYAVGKGISPWYACWKAEAFARIGMGREAWECLTQAFQSIGVFYEMFEINEPGKQYRPWFTTASGILLSTVNDMLVQSDGKNIWILPAFPCENADLSFKLSIKGGAVLEVLIKDGDLVQLKLTGKTDAKFRIHYRDRQFDATVDRAVSDVLI